MRPPDALLIARPICHDAVFNRELLCISRRRHRRGQHPHRPLHREHRGFKHPRPNATRSRSCCCARSQWPRVTLSAPSMGGIPRPRAIRSPRSWRKGRTAFAGGGVRQAPRRHRPRRDRSRVANAALKLDMEVSGYDPYLSVDSAWNLFSKVEHVTDLNVLSPTCDYSHHHIHSTRRHSTIERRNVCEDEARHAHTEFCPA